MLLMRLPQRFWGAKYAEIVDDQLRGVVERYLRQLDAMLDGGDGLLFWGANGVGKTCAACVIAKEARRRGAPVLFTTAEGLRSAVLEKMPFSDDMLFIDRARSVDVLLLDDLGKEHRGKGWSDSTFENLFRERSAARRTTLITTNLTLEQLAERYDLSMLEVMKETTVPIHVEGNNRRDEAGEALRRRLAVG
jgi:DNA replication protein DnaC